MNSIPSEDAVKIGEMTDPLWIPIPAKVYAAEFEALSSSTPEESAEDTERSETRRGPRAPHRVSPTTRGAKTAACGNYGGRPTPSGRWRPPRQVERSTQTPTFPEPLWTSPTGHRVSPRDRRPSPVTNRRRGRGVSASGEELFQAGSTRGKFRRLKYPGPAVSTRLAAPPRPQPPPQAASRAADLRPDPQTPDPPFSPHLPPQGRLNPDWGTPKPRAQREEKNKDP
ncbi:WW domain-binding protein 11-like [Canis lupus dingo]|uniref:WW domain-binding protein 11-like n=1 Tax=Canis lupus dingo TaxID=286419 RepID=UPI0020C330C7|nr:WW domain-binding protein 11-like [Canis lupus dingo]